MDNSFWEGGGKDLAKTVVDQAESRIKSLQSKLSATNDPDTQDQLRSSIAEVRSECDQKLKQINDSLF